MAQLGYAEAQVEQSQGKAACPNGKLYYFKGSCPSARAKLFVHYSKSWSAALATIHLPNLGSLPPDMLDSVPLNELEQAQPLVMNKPSVTLERYTDHDIYIYICILIY